MVSRSTSLRFSLLVAVALVAFLAGRWSSPFSPLAGSPGALKPSGGTQAVVEPNKPASGSIASGKRVPEKSEFAARAARAPSSLATDDAREKTLEEWAETDPAGAIEFAHTKLQGDRRAQAVSAILAIWGKNDPAAAWAWVSTNDPTATHHFDTLLEVFGKNSPAVAARFVNEFVQTHPETALEVNLAALLGITYTGDFTAARAFVDNNASLTPEVRGNLNNFIAGQWARYAPEDAAAWTMSLPAGPQRDQALIGLGESWAGADPAGAAKFAEALPAGEPRQLALRQAITNWLQTNPDQARQWVLDNNTHEDYDQAVAAIATQNNLMFRDPDRALQWAATIFDDTIRYQSIGAILAGVYSRDPAGTVAYIRNANNLTDDQRTQLLSQFPPKQ